MLSILRQVRSGRFLDDTLLDLLDVPDLKREDASLVREVVYGTLRHRRFLDYHIEVSAKRSVRSLHPDVLDLLRLSCYQILFLDRVPDFAAVNEAVSLARRVCPGRPGVPGFVNGCLRGVIRNRQSLALPSRSTDLVRHLGVCYSHPDWLVSYWLDHMDSRDVESLLSANNLVPPFTVRTNTLKTDRASLAYSLADRGFESIPGEIAPEALILKNPAGVMDIDLYENGHFFVQDEASMVVSLAVAPRPGERIIDACSAPGGKTTHMAALMGNEGEILALDISEERIQRVRENCARLGVTCVRCAVSDARKLQDVHLADRVLVDAPCSGLGVIRRNPDIKWGRSMRDIRGLAVLQKEILAAASKWVRPGGVLVYSTCTLSPIENEGVVEEFLASSDFVPDALPEGFPGAAPGSCMARLAPSLQGTDGFFIYRMRRGGPDQA